MCTFGDSLCKNIRQYTHVEYLVRTYISGRSGCLGGCLGGRGPGAGHAEEGRLTLQFSLFGIFYVLNHGLLLPVQILNTLNGRRNKRDRKLKEGLKSVEERGRGRKEERV